MVDEPESSDIYSSTFVRKRSHRDGIYEGDQYSIDTFLGIQAAVQDNYEFWNSHFHSIMSLAASRREGWIGHVRDATVLELILMHHPSI
jgi:hypothetical protein